MKKSKSVSEPYIVVVDKLRDALNMEEEENKPDTIIIADLGSPITPLQIRPSGLTSTSSSSSGSSGSFTTKPDPDQPAAQTKTTTVHSPKSKSGSTSATQSGSNSPANATSGSTSPSGAKTLPNSPKAPARTGNTRLARRNSTSPVKILPGGNLFPSGKVQITGMTQGVPKSVVLGPAAPKSYGYGSVFRGSGSGSSLSQAAKPTTSGCSSFGSPVAAARRSTNVPDEGTLSKKVVTSSNPETVKEKGNEMYRKGCFAEALKLYDRAIELSPSNAAYHSNRAAALSSLGRIGEAVNECDKAIKLDPKFIRAHHRLASLLLRLGHVDNAGKHFYAVEEPSDPMVVKMLQLVDKHLNKCTYARRRGEWNLVLSEVSAAIKSGADFSPQLAMCKVEALLKLLRLDDAQTELAFVPKVEPFPASLSQTRFFGMICEAYTSFVKSQLELALGRFANAVTFAERASEIDPKNSEVEMLYRNVRLIARARNRGNALYESERYTEASAAYGEGLNFDTSNVTLLRQRAECFFKVGMWESAVEDCNHALLIQPGHLEPLRQRAASYFKMERWAEAVRDYETLRKELPYDKEIAESLFHAQVALKKSRGEVVLDMEFGGEVEEVFSLVELKAALTRPGVSIVFFTRASDQQCKEISVFVDALCVRYLSLHFLKVEIEKHPQVGDAEKVRVVPTFKIYKLGIRIKEIVCPSKETLENSVRHYSL